MDTHWQYGEAPGPATGDRPPQGFVTGRIGRRPQVADGPRRGAVADGGDREVGSLEAEEDMADKARARKVSDRIKVIVAEMLETRIKDPRLGFITITDARVTGDLHDATVYYTVYGSEEEKAGTAAALESAKGVIRSEIGKQTGVRFTPTVTFVADAVPENALAIEDLLSQAAAADAEVQEKAAAATYAGEPDPYKKPRDEDDELDGERAGATA